MNFEIRSARPEELPDLYRLLDISGLPAAGVEEHFPNYLVAEADQHPVGVVGLEVYGPVGLLRSLAVDPTQQGRGIGDALVRAVLEKAREKRLEAIYLLTTTAEAYFPRFGFEPIARERVDPRLHASRELQGACPQSARCMMRVMSPSSPVVDVDR